MKHSNKESNCRVLIAEDNVSQQVLFADVLRDEGFSVFVTSTGNEALGALLAAGHVDLLVADIGLQGRMNGFELANQARRLQPKIKTLLITGYPKEIAYQQRDADHDAEMMFKPFKLNDFVGRVIALTEHLPCRKLRVA